MKKDRGRYDARLAAARRKQILDAATVCFLRDGFRGASMADISVASGMSTGHIYHYFESKEAIVEAVIEQEQLAGPVILEELKSLDDIVQVVFQNSVDGMANRSGPADPVLVLDSLAEASRNPAVAAIFRDYDVALQARLRDIVSTGQKMGEIGTGTDVEQLGLFLKIILYGSAVLRALSPDFDADRLKLMLRLAFLLSETPDGRIGTPSAK